MNRPVTSTDIERLKKNPTNRSPGPDDFTGEYYETFREVLMSFLLKLFPKNLWQSNLWKESSKLIL